MLSIRLRRVSLSACAQMCAPHRAGSSCSSIRGGQTFSPDDSFQEVSQQGPASLLHTVDGVQSIPAVDSDSLTASTSGSIPAKLDGAEASDEAHVLPNIDPQHWTTAHVILWVRTVGEAGIMDESMQQGFRLMQVDGNTLLKKVSRNKMFRVMRRWQLKRKALLEKGVSDAEAMAEIAGEFRGAVDFSMVQDAIYLRYPQK